MPHVAASPIDTFSGLSGTLSDVQHGTRSGGTLHAEAIAGGAAGFLSGADKTKLGQFLPAASKTLTVSNTLTLAGGSDGFTATIAQSGTVAQLGVNNNGLFGVGVSPTAQLEVQTGATNRKAMVIRSTSGATVSMAEFYEEGGALSVVISRFGILSANDGFTAKADAGDGTNMLALVTGTGVTCQARNAGSSAFTAKGFSAAQSAVIARVANHDESAVYWSILASGAMAAKTIDAATSAITAVATFGHNSTGTPAANYGSRLLWQLESSTTEDQDAAADDTTWSTATHATRTAQRRGYLAKNGTLTEAWRYDHLDDATQTNAWLLYNNVLTRVLVGAADSGGTGFRLLRVTN